MGKLSETTLSPQGDPEAHKRREPVLRSALHVSGVGDETSAHVPLHEEQSLWLVAALKGHSACSLHYAQEGTWPSLIVRIGIEGGGVRRGQRFSVVTFPVQLVEQVLRATFLRTVKSP